jgi:hypothetical protein
LRFSENRNLTHRDAGGGEVRSIGSGRPHALPLFGFLLVIATKSLARENVVSPLTERISSGTIVMAKAEI